MLHPIQLDIAACLRTTDSSVNLRRTARCVLTGSQQRHAADCRSRAHKHPALRAEREWSQAKLAAQVGVTRQTINSIEKGRFQPNLRLAFKIARALGSGSLKCLSTRIFKKFGRLTRCPSVRFTNKSANARVSIETIAFKPLFSPEQLKKTASGEHILREKILVLILGTLSRAVENNHPHPCVRNT